MIHNTDYNTISNYWNNYSSYQSDSIIIRYRRYIIYKNGRFIVKILMEQDTKFNEKYFIKWIDSDWVEEQV